MKPMLAATMKGTLASGTTKLASTKLDGVRCLVINGVAMSRSLKPIPNKHVQDLFGRKELNGLDGELIVGKPTDPDVYRTTMSCVMSIQGCPDVYFYVFDDFSHEAGFALRLKAVGLRLASLKHLRPGRLKIVEHVAVATQDDLLQLEQSYLNAGYEGVMLRDPDGPYKHGRSTEKEGWLLKLKQFMDSEAKIIGFTELMHNTNEAKTNELGHKERSSKKAGLKGRGVLGALMVRDIKTGVEFDIGTGFDELDRREIWGLQKDLMGKIVKYKYFPGGVKDKPRFPVFLGFRDQIDM